MKNAWPILIFLFLHSSSALKCASRDQDQCLCIPGTEYEFQCPSNFPDSADLLIIHIKEDFLIHIDCPFLETFQTTLLPNVTVSAVEKLWMRSCPLPQHSFKEVIGHFNVSTLKRLQYGSFDLSNVTLSKSFFQDLEDLKDVQLNGNSLVHLEEDVFASFSNLTSLELQRNRIVLKKELFRYTPSLKSLDISENDLESIPDGMFESVPKLELLHLWGNSLSSITDTTFSGLISLRSLELSSNKIQSISEDAFKFLVNLSRLNLSLNRLKTLLPGTLSHNTKLKQFVMNNNPNLTLPDYFLADLPLLEDVQLINCKLSQLPENLFVNSTSLKTLKLGSNRLRELPERVFNNLGNLKEIYLDNNQLVKVDTIFTNLKQVEILDLRNNQIVEIGAEAFKDLSNLKEIYLQRNKIVKIDNKAFMVNEKLRNIDLSNNQYAGDDSQSFIILLDNVINIEKVNLSHNKIVEIGSVISVTNKVYLESLDLSHNQITSVLLTELQPLAKKLIVNLQHNNITRVDFNNVNEITQDVRDAFSARSQPHAVIYLRNNPLECDCFNYELVRYFQDDVQPQVKVMFDIKATDLKCASPEELQHMDLESVPQKLLVCSFEKIEEKTCPEMGSCAWRPYDQSVIVNFSYKNLTEFPRINTSLVNVSFKQIEVHLEGNELESLERNLTGYAKVSKLYLSHNKLKNVEWLPPRLQILHLDHNKIEHFGFNVLDTLNTSSLMNLTLEENPWRCDCDAQNLTMFLRQHSKVVDGGSIFCTNSTQRLVDLNRNDLCHTFGIAAAAISILVVLLLVAVFIILYFYYQQPIKVWLYSHNLLLWWVTEEELDKDKIYDAFISFSHKDEDFVTQNLVTMLERGPNPYKLCLHYRDFVPGEFILTQVTNAVLDSRRTLVVLSPNFLESVWGKAEFRTAHTQAMTEGRARVIIVLYGDVDLENLDDELKAYTKTNTYVKWGDPYFWRKLKYALPHSKIKNSNNQKIANVMSCIDDKFNLVAPVTASPGSTPPVLNVDSQVLKKHPLNFVPRSEGDVPATESGTLLVSTGL